MCVMYVVVSRGVCMGACGCTCVWEPEADFAISSLCFQTVSLTESKVHQLLVSQTHANSVLMSLRTCIHTYKYVHEHTTHTHRVSFRLSETFFLTASSRNALAWGYSIYWVPLKMLTVSPCVKFLGKMCFLSKGMQHRYATERLPL